LIALNTFLLAVDSQIVNQKHNYFVLLKHFTVHREIAKNVLIVDKPKFSGHLMEMDTKTFNQKIGILLQKLRTENRMTQDELAKLTGMSRASIANMETGRQAMSAYQAYLIVTAFQLRDMNALFPSPEIDTEGADVKLSGSSQLNEIQRQQVEALIARSTT
jgi:DNA-binding XRE family transcriptional regulator